MSKLSTKIYNGAFLAVDKMGVWKAVQKIAPKILTILNYHRVSPWDENVNLTFKPNLSASPEMFESQMDYMNQHFNIISEADLVTWLNGGDDLPLNAALITFDDGYQDNYQYAYPILKERNLGATIFLTTNFLDEDFIFYWDLAAYCIHKTKKKVVEISRLGEFSWQNGEEYSVIQEIVNRIKYLSPMEIPKVLAELSERLGVEVDENYFKTLSLSWDQVLEMANNGIDIGSHTVSHPILSNIPVERAQIEISESKNRIEEILRKDVQSIAYPNGQVGDYTNKVVSLVRESGYKIAYSLISGPTSYKEVSGERYAIRRIFLSHLDTMPRFIAKVHGLARFV